MRFPTFCCVETRYISKSMPHSHSRMVEARKEAHAYCFEFGKPTFFVTISKLDSACIEIKWLSNEDCEDVTPSKTFRYNLLAMFPGAAALSFDRLVRLFVKHMLQFDCEKQRPFYDDTGAFRKGVFGETVAFFGSLCGLLGQASLPQDRHANQYPLNTQAKPLGIPTARARIHWL